MNNAEEAKRLLDNGYSILLFVDGLGQYSALAVPKGNRVDVALREWRRHDSPEGMDPADTVFDGPNQFCGCGLSVGQALHAVAEKVILRRLPDRVTVDPDHDPNDGRR